MGITPGAVRQTAGRTERPHAHYIAAAGCLRATFQPPAKPLNWPSGGVAAKHTYDEGSGMAVAIEEPKAVVLRSDDNVAVAARPIPRGFLLNANGATVEVREPIGLGHKVALVEIASGEPVRK